MLKRIFIIFTLFVSLSGASLAVNDVNGNPIDTSKSIQCKSADMFGSKLISDICWSCIFPIKIMGKPLFGTEYKAPPGSTNKSVCSCKDKLGVPSWGVTSGMFEPARIIEVVKTPYCSPILDGMSLNNDSFNGLGNSAAKTHANRIAGTSPLGFYNYHYFSFPLMQMIGIAGLPNCTTDGFVTMGGLAFSEWDPMWQDEELGFFQNPESVIFGNPIAQLACAGDCVATNFNKPNDKLFWCAGCWGSMTPLSGFFDGGTSLPNNTSLLVTRAVNLQFRRGLESKTMGDDVVKGRCMAKGYFPVIPKTQYKMSMVYPLPEANDSISSLGSAPEGEETDDGKKYNMGDLVGKGSQCCHPLGKSTILTGNEHRNIPGREDYIYMLFRYKDCCNASK